MTHARSRLANRFGLLAAGLLLTASATLASGPTRVETGNRVSEGIPELPAALLKRLERYQEIQGAGFAGWLTDAELLIASRVADTTQIYRLREPDGEREQLTDYPDPISAVATARQGGAGFVFAKDVDGAEEWQLYYYDVASGQARQLSDGNSRNQGAVWSRDGRRFAYSTTRRNGVDSDVHIMDLDGGNRPLIELGGGGWVVQDWSPDDQLLLVLEYFSINQSRPWLVRVETGQVALLRDSRQTAAYGRLAFAPDGRGVYYTSDQDGELRNLFHLDLRSGRSRNLTRGIRRDIDDFVISPDGSHVAFISNEDGYGRLHLRSLPRHRKLKLPALPDGVVSLGGFSPNGEQLAVTITSAIAPGDVYVLDLRDGELARWSRSEPAGLDLSGMVEPALIHFPSFDRTGDHRRRQIPAFYHRPAERGDGRKFPVVISLHGGPEVQARPGFSAMTQFLVNELGVAVLVPNVRGSSGYGKSYLRLDDGKKREDAVRDIGALLDWIAQQPELDAGRVGVTGGSYGGYLTLAALVEYSDRLRAGISVVGISNFVTFLENTSIYRQDLRRIEYGDERDPAMRAFLASISPLTNAARIRRPLFVAQGANDPRVPLAEAEQIARAVRANGQDVWYLVFTDEGHGFTKKPNRDYFNAASMLFWQTYLLDHWK